MKKSTIIAIIIGAIGILVAVAAAAWYFGVLQTQNPPPPPSSQPSSTPPVVDGTPPPPEEPEEPLDNLIRITSPLPNATVQSPLTVTGQARGTWYFEASFPVRVLDGNGKELAVVPAQAQGEWMTEEFVPFRATLTFTAPTTATGTVVFQKDNPSGLPQFEDERRIPVRFIQNQRSIQLYYYDSEKDKDGQGNIQCSRQGLVAVDRTIPVTITPIQDAIRLLLKGELTAQERASGVTTEFPLPGVALNGATLRNGQLTLEFTDPQNRTGGGSCRVGILWAQIEATAKQLPEVTSVRFIPEELFQP